MGGVIRGLVGLCVIGVLVSACSGADDKSENEDSDSQFAATFDKSRALTLCEMEMQSRALSQGSYRSAMARTLTPDVGGVMIRRNFTVKNAFGVEMSGSYSCLVNETTNTIISLNHSMG